MYACPAISRDEYAVFRASVRRRAFERRRQYAFCRRLRFTAARQEDALCRRRATPTKDAPRAVAAAVERHRRPSPPVMRVLSRDAIAPSGRGGYRQDMDRREMEEDEEVR